MNTVSFASFGTQNATQSFRAAPPQADPADNKPTRGERLVSRFDKNDDGKLGLSELQGTRLGKRMSVDRFARTDKDGDGMLSAAELTPGRKGKADGFNPGAVKSAVLAKMADYLAAQVPQESESERLTRMVIERLDSNGNGTLNSEEIAGTRLAEKLGGDFFERDADRSGTLDAAELGSFIADEILGLAEPVATDDDGGDDVEVDDDDIDDDVKVSTGPVTSNDDIAPDAPVAAVEDVDPVDAVEAPEETEAPATAMGSGAPASVPDMGLNAFETALKLLQDSQQNRMTYDVLSTFYNDVKTIVSA